MNGDQSQYVKRSSPFNIKRIKLVDAFISHICFMHLQKFLTLKLFVTSFPPTCVANVPDKITKTILFTALNLALTDQVL